MVVSDRQLGTLAEVLAWDLDMLCDAHETLNTLEALSEIERAWAEEDAEARRENR